MLGVLFAVALVFVGLVYLKMGPFLSSRTGISLPVFETYPSSGTEATVKQLDKCIYDALLALGVHAEQVAFNDVETKQSGHDHWTFSDMAVRLNKPCTSEQIKKIFSSQVASVTPKPSLHVSGTPDNETVVELMVNGHLTHQLNLFFLPKRLPIPSPPARLPYVAIIIDDMGYDRAIVSQFLALDSNLSFSVLPYSPFERQIATSAHNSGRDVLLHLPMEPLEYPDVDPGQGSLMSFMTPDEMLSQLKADLDTIPFIVGVNNHMGSKLTQDASRMRQIFTVLKKRHLFFVDSMTSPKSRCAQAAGILKLKFARRQVFLDHVQDPHAIRFQIKRLISIANKKGSAIGIGHPYPVTLEVLRKNLGRIKSQVRLVPVSQLVG